MFPYSLIKHLPIYILILSHCHCCLYFELFWFCWNAHLYVKYCKVQNSGFIIFFPIYMENSEMLSSVESLLTLPNCLLTSLAPNFVITRKKCHSSFLQISPSQPSLCWCLLDELQVYSCICAVFPQIRDVVKENLDACISLSSVYVYVCPGTSEVVSGRRQEESR